MLTPKQVAAYARMCRKEGISYLNMAGFELTMADHRIEEAKVKPAQQQASIPGEPETKPEFSEDDLLFWSSSPTV